MTHLKKFQRIISGDLNNDNDMVWRFNAFPSFEGIPRHGHRNRNYYQILFQRFDPEQDNSDFEILHIKRCQICKSNLNFISWFIHKEDKFIYKDCGGSEISEEQFNTGLLYPICHQCNRIVQTQDFRYVSEAGCIYHLEINIVRKIIPHMFLPEPELPTWLFPNGDE